ncbi:hypothetical protein DEA8626_00889 [Defluviimonas aquaemixtae]|uniref:Colicin V production protein n=1 Tax=Albidovulum aquaemixtae TaxID=1542388 RepID=A0A2R8B3Z8_9RHOB|nr:CvpA family protein [Defluviimonas aquaemixtae]SPH17371.1 hypothetical protein DEA8626_00889 [Defluviimonas aquaemixtae]
MEGFTIVDAVVAVILLMSAILAYSRGVVREVLAIAGWVAAAVVAFIFAPKAVPLIKQIPVLDKFLGDNCEISTVVSFGAVLAVALIVMSIFTPLFSSAVQRSALSGVDQGLGFLFGILRGVLLVAIAFVVYDRALAGSSIPAVDQSKSAEVFASLSGNLEEALPEDAPGWLEARYGELVAECGSGTTSTTQTQEEPADTGN